MDHQVNDYVTLSGNKTKYKITALSNGFAWLEDRKGNVVVTEICDLRKWKGREKNERRDSN